MDILFAGWCAIGWTILLGLLFGTPLVCMAVIRKWTALMSQIVQRPEYADLKKLLGNRIALLLPIITAFIVLVLKGIEKYKYEALILAVMDLSIHPSWILISICGFWILRNFSNSSAKNLRIERLMIIAGSIAYLLMAAWFVLLPVTVTQSFVMPFYYLSPLNLVLGVTFLRTSYQPVPEKRRPLKYIIRDIAVGYAIILLVFAFPPFWTD